jgi:hypothetical protein
MPKKVGFLGTAVLAAVAFALSAYAAGGPMMMGSAKPIKQPSFQGYYDGHKDTYLNTDISSRAEARARSKNRDDQKIAGSRQT